MNGLFSNLTSLGYLHVVKPLFFRFDPESVHDFNVRLGSWLGKNAVARWAIKTLWAYRSPLLHQKIDGILFTNPIGLSAGFDYNGQLTDILPAVGFGFQTIGTVTLESYQGNQPPRLGRLPRSQALLVNKGLKNDGAKKIIKRLRHFQLQTPTGISIASTNKKFRSEAEQIRDILACFKLFQKAKLPIQYFELNISCPNTFGGEPFTSPMRLEHLMKEMDKLHLAQPLYIKMPIDQSPAETLKLLKVLYIHQVSGVIFGNLTKDKQNPAVDPQDRKIWQSRSGNLSGKPTWQRSNALITLTRQKFGQRFTIIGTGGVFTPQDAAAKLAAGADLIQLITGMIYQGPQVIGQMNRYLAQKYC